MKVTMTKLVVILLSVVVLFQLTCFMTCCFAQSKPHIMTKDGLLPITCYDNSSDFCFAGRDLSGVYFSLMPGDDSVTYGTLCRVNFSKCDLRGAKFDNILLKKCVFEGADMRGFYYVCDVYYESLIDCDFENALIHGDVEKGIFTIVFSMSAKQVCQSKSYRIRNLSNMVIERWREAEYYIDRAHIRRHTDRKLPEIDFSKCNLQNTRLPEVSRSSRFDEAIIKGARLTGLTKKQLYTTSNYKNGIINDTVFIETYIVDENADNFNDVNFANFNLTGCGFNLDIHNADFTNAIISNCNFDFQGLDEKHQITVNQIKTTWNYKNDRMNSIKLPERIRKELESEK
jgi:uncharacterized protein YjbI with pentapeptide repeats